MAVTPTPDGTVVQIVQVVLPPTEQHAVQTASTTPFQMNIAAQKGVPVQMERLAWIALQLEAPQETDGRQLLLRSAVAQQQHTLIVTTLTQ
jgi:hypothetical protein